MTQHEIRQSIIDAMNQEASNGIWKSWEVPHGDIIFCTMDVIIDPEFLGRMKGIVQVLKGMGSILVEPYHEGEVDKGHFIKLTITPRV